MKNWARWTFRGIFVAMIVYHIWSFYNFGFESLALINPNFNQGIGILLKSWVIIVNLVGNLVNYLIQIGLPLIAFYFGFIYKSYEYLE